MHIRPLFEMTLSVKYSRDCMALTCAVKDCMVNVQTRADMQSATTGRLKPFRRPFLYQAYFPASIIINILFTYYIEKAKSL